MRYWALLVALVLPVVGAGAVLACGIALDAEVYRAGVRHAALHQVAHYSAFWSVPLALIGSLMLRAHQKFWLEKARGGECLSNMRGAWWLRLLKCAGWGLIAAPVATYLLLSFVLDGSFDWQCSLGPPMDAAYTRAMLCGVAVAVGFGVWIGLKFAHNDRLSVLSRIVITVPAFAGTALAIFTTAMVLIQNFF